MYDTPAIVGPDTVIRCDRSPAISPKNGWSPSPRRGMDMKPSRFTEEQIIGILREQEAGAKTTDGCRKHGVSSATFYKWKAKYGGLEVSDAKRLKALEDENAKLKKLLAEAMLGVDPVRPDTRLVEVLQCTPAVSG